MVTPYRSNFLLARYSWLLMNMGRQKVVNRHNFCISLLVIVTRTGPQFTDHGPNVVTITPLRKHTAIIAKFANRSYRWLINVAPVITRLNGRVRTLCITVIDGTHRVQINRTGLFTLMSVQHSLRTVRRRHRRFYHERTMFAFVAGTEGGTQLVIIAPRRNVPYCIIRSLLPITRRYFRHRGIEFDRHPFFAAKVVSLRIVGVGNRQRFATYRDHMSLTVLGTNKKRFACNRWPT